MNIKVTTFAVTEPQVIVRRLVSHERALDRLGLGIWDVGQVGGVRGLRGFDGKEIIGQWHRENAMPIAPVKQGETVRSLDR